MNCYPLSICAMLALVQSSAFAQDASVGTTSIMDTCAEEYASSKIDPVRNKIAILGSPVTDDMLKNKSKPSAEEKKTLRAYMVAEISCTKSLNAIVFKDNEKMRLAKDGQVKKNVEVNIKPLIDEKIAYAEYNKHAEQAFKRGKEAAKKVLMEAGIDSHWYENHFEAQFGSGKSAYPPSSPWWGFYNYAIAIAKDMDSGKIAYEEGNKLINDRLAKVNQVIADGAARTVVTLNCLVHGPNGEQVEIPMTIDYTNMKVDGYKADFNVNLIRWSIPSTDGSSDTYYALNRLSGFLNVGNNQLPSFMTGYCSPAQRQF